MQILSINDIVKATGGKVICGSDKGVIHAITTDSRQADKDVLFIPLKGEKADGHDYILSALDKGAISISEREIDSDKTVIKVADTRLALGDIARYYKAKYPVPTVSITGKVFASFNKYLL